VAAQLVASQEGLNSMELVSYVDVGAYGKSSDSALFKESVLYKKLVHRNLDLPQPKHISNIDTTPLPYVFIGDEAFGIMENVMRPYSGKSLTRVKKSSISGFLELADTLNVRLV
jgi:hypothetical protein